MYTAGDNSVTHTPHKLYKPKVQSVTPNILSSFVKIKKIWTLSNI